MNPDTIIMQAYLGRIADALEDIAENGIDVTIKFPDVIDKFVTDLPAMKVVDALKNVSEAIWHINGGE